MPDANPQTRIFPQIIRGRFNNYQNEASEDSFYHSFLMYLQSLLARQSTSHEVIKSWHEPSVIEHASPFRITWLGHSTYLIQLDGKNILTDPVFGDLTFVFPRILPCGLQLAEIPKIDCVLISHNHRDHMDKASLIGLKKRFPELRFLVPQGDKQWFDRRGFSNVTEYMWWQQLEIDGLSCTFLPAFHWSQRGLFDRNKSLWGSWMIEAGGRVVYFAGDTAYADHFTRIAHFFPHIDVALMPIGPCEPRAWMRGSHVDAAEAGQAFLDLKAHQFFPMHWGTFYFGVDTFLGPVERLGWWWQANTQLLIAKQLHLPKVGQAFDLCEPLVTAAAQRQLIY